MQLHTFFCSMFFLIMTYNSAIYSKGHKVLVDGKESNFNCCTTGRVEEQGKWPGDVCKKGVGNNYLRRHLAVYCFLPTTHTYITHTVHTI